MNLCLFDLDDTLIPLDSDHAWGEFITGLGWVDAAEFRRRNDEFFEAYQAVDQWARDQIPFAWACFAQTTRMLSRENRLAKDTIRLGDRPISLRDITCPLLNVIAERDHLAPIEAASPLTSAVGSKDVEELRIDAGHVGLFIGRSSRKVTLPKVIDWMRRHTDEL